MRTVTARLSKTALLLIAVLSLVAATAVGVGAEPPDHAQNEHAGETGPPDHAQNEHAGDTGPPEHAHNDEANAAEKVTLCHATGSDRNPFVEITVSVNAVTTEGHSSHQDGRDIIPSFEGFAGQNWDADGQARFAAGCVLDDDVEEVEEVEEVEDLEHVDETAVVEGDEVVNVRRIDVDLVPEQPIAGTVVQPSVEQTRVADDTAVLGATVTRGALARTGSSSVAMLALSGLALMLLGFALRRSARAVA